MRFAYVLALLTLSSPAIAEAADAYARYYYGPINGYGDGYTDKATKDGYWEIHAGIARQSALAADFAIYRAAEMAKAAGHRYVEIHDAFERRSRYGVGETITLYARPSDLPQHPASCRSGKPKRCYTADVALVFARLSGADGAHPGLAAPSYVDRYGRTVTESGFGTGAVGSAPQ